MADYRQYFQVVRRPVSEHAVQEFMTRSGRYSNFKKETCFLRYLGGSEYGAILEQLRRWQGADRANGSGYVFVPELAKQPDQSEVERYVELYHDGDYCLPVHFKNPILEEALIANFREILQMFQKSRGRAEKSILRNFTIKMFCWMDQYFPQLFLDTSRIACFPKFACSGKVKLPEYLFLYLLYQMGCDVLYVGGGQDVCVEAPDLLQLSARVEAQEPQTMAVSDTASPASRPGKAQPAGPSRPQAPAEGQPSARRPESGPVAGEKRLLTYEELANMASSVVMLQVFDAQNQCFKTGSGVIINESGYILTNCHVVSGGRYFGVLLEEEPDVFYTDELIKYHQDQDLAILRMDRHRAPIPVWRGPSRLVRGQKVVAIGSPLGLFNTVSDGIISGFRKVGERTMIQFTAPTSHGSSGGALLDLYGNLIGIITAGFDDGQNLNLAVDYQAILEFARGLL